MAEIRAELGVEEIDLAHEQAVARRLAQGGQAGGDVGRVARMDVVERRVLGVQRQRGRTVAGRVVAQLGVLHEPVQRVEAEAVHPAPEPEADDVRHGRDDLGVAPVEVGLFRIEGVEVPAAAVGVARPGRAAEGRTPVVRRLRRVADDVEVGALAEPRVLDRRVAGHEVHEHAQAQPLGLDQQGVEVVEGPEARVDGVEVADVVAEVVVWARVERRQPHRLRAQRGHVREPLHGAAQVAEAVAVAVLKRARVDLVDGCSLPPHGE